MKINVREFLGDKIHVEDAIILRDYIEDNLNENVELDLVVQVEFQLLY